jgi:hypothetical protein
MLWHLPPPAAHLAAADCAQQGELRKALDCDAARDGVFGAEALERAMRDLDIDELVLELRSDAYTHSSPQRHLSPTAVMLRERHPDCWNELNPAVPHCP